VKISLRRRLRSSDQVLLVYYPLYSTYLSVYVVLQGSCGHERCFVAGLEISSLSIPHLCDQVEEFFWCHSMCNFKYILYQAIRYILVSMGAGIYFSDSYRHMSARLAVGQVHVLSLSHCLLSVDVTGFRTSHDILVVDDEVRCVVVLQILAPLPLLVELGV